MQRERVANDAAAMHRSGASARAEDVRASAANEGESRTTAPRGDLVRQIVALGVGATAMYFLDPDRGRRRRHLVRDKLVHAAKESGDAIGTTTRDLTNRAGGLAAVARRRLRDDQPDDGVLADRVHATLGRVISHPSAISVVSQQGRIVLSGPVLAEEADTLITRIRRVRGVAEVVDDLERHATADVPELQGGRQPAESKFELLQDHWTPAARVIAGVTGGAVAAICLRGDGRRKPLSAAMGLAGAALAVRSATNMPFDRLIGVGAGRRAITVRKSITIAGPISEVFTWLVAWERWPRWMSHVRDVRSLGDSRAVGERTHWVVDGPAGTTVEWDAETTRFDPPTLLAWRTVEGSPVAHTGTIQLVRTDADATRLDVTISYQPIAGVAGHALVAMFRRDPTHQLEDDLARLKTTIETGQPPRDAAVRDGPSPIDVITP